MGTPSAGLDPYDVPDAALRAGDFSSLHQQLYFAGRAPASEQHDSAEPHQPLGNLAAEVLAAQSHRLVSVQLPDPVIGETHQDQMRAQLNKNIGNKNFLYGYYAFQRTAADTNNANSAFSTRPTALGQESIQEGQLAAPYLNQRMFAHFH